MKSYFRPQQPTFDFENGGPVNVPLPTETEQAERLRQQDRMRERQRAEQERMRERAQREQRERAERLRADYERARQERQRQRRAWENAWRAQGGSYFATGSAVDPYAALGVPYGADKAAVRAAWAKLVRQYHPDVGGDPAKFRAVQEAYDRIKGGR